MNIPSLAEIIHQGTALSNVRLLLAEPDHEVVDQAGINLVEEMVGVHRGVVSGAVAMHNMMCPIINLLTSLWVF
jgi:hypothetical protein